MASPARNERGGALAEALPVMALLLALTLCALIGTYLIFARAWLQYRGEQALYCLAEGRGNFACRRELEQSLRAALPFGHSGVTRLFTTGETWEVRLEWIFRNYSFRVQKELSVRRLLRSRALR